MGATASSSSKPSARGTKTDGVGFSGRSTGGGFEENPRFQAAACPVTADPKSPEPQSHPGMSSPSTPPDDRNGFDAIRLLLAVLVVYSHAFLLGGFGEEHLTSFVHGQTIAGSVAVLGFFGVSGFLVTRSFAQRADWRAYVRSRALRILPGYYLALIFTAFVAAPLISSRISDGPRWNLTGAGEYVLRNAWVKVGAWHVAGIPYGLPYNGSLNGALWSLFPELCCYAVVAVVGLAGWLRRPVGRIHLLLFASAVGIAHVALSLAPEIKHLAPAFLQLSGVTPFITSFLVGSLLYCFQSELVLGRGTALLWTAVALALLKFGGWNLLGPFVLPLALTNLAYSFHLRLRNDLSYGVYIFHFPVLQVMSAYGLMKLGYWAYLIVALMLTLICAVLSWLAVERPFLRMKR